MLAKKTILLILDGWGHGDQSKSDAIHHAKTPSSTAFMSLPTCRTDYFGQEVDFRTDKWVIQK